MFTHRRASTARHQLLASLVLGSFLLINNSSPVFAEKENQGQAASPLNSMRVSGPYKSGNLAVYLIHGKDTAPNQKLITLSEGLSKKSVVVHETSNVNELTVENLGEEAVFIQSGDIVKGGQQDRTLQYDMVLKPKSGKVAIKSFCVESGRWTQRGQESPAHFGSSPNMVSSKSLKIAAKGYANQGKVWQEVSNLQQKYKQEQVKKRLDGALAAPASPTSLELTLESEPVKKLSEKYVKDISPICAGNKDAIGYAFAINGKINSADVYASHDLFQRLWPKLVSATAQEAASEGGDDKAPEAPAPDAVKKYLAEASAGKETKEEGPGKTISLKRESGKTYFFQSRAQMQINGAPDVWVHMNYLSK